MSDPNQKAARSDAVATQTSRWDSMGFERCGGSMVIVADGWFARFMFQSVSVVEWMTIVGALICILNREGEWSGFESN